MKNRIQKLILLIIFGNSLLCFIYHQLWKFNSFEKGNIILSQMRSVSCLYCIHFNLKLYNNRIKLLKNKYKNNGSKIFKKISKPINIYPKNFLVHVKTKQHSLQTHICYLTFLVHSSVKDVNFILKDYTADVLCLG